MEVSDGGIARTGTVPAGRVFIDVSGMGDVGNSVLQDRKKLSTDGIVIVTAVIDSYSGGLVLPVDIQSKGLVFRNGASEFSSLVVDACADVFDHYARSSYMDIPALKSRVKDVVAKLIFDKTRRAPVVVVTVLSV